MEITLKFYKPEDKMPERFEDSHTSNDCLVKTKDGEYYDFAHYDFKEQKWENSASWDDYHGYQELENVEMWAQIPRAGNHLPVFETRT